MGRTLLLKSFMLIIIINNTVKPVVNIHFILPLTGRLML